MEDMEDVLTDEEAGRLVEWVMEQGYSEQKAYEALAYTMGVKLDSITQAVYVDGSENLQ